VIKPPSAIKEYTLIYSGDDALALPDDPSERANALRVARETGDWSRLITPGMQPTLFHMRPVSGTLYDWLAGEWRRRRLVDSEAYALAVRLALRRIENFGDHKVIVENEAPNLATVAIIDALYDVRGGRELMTELGALVLERAQASPK
jgi:hypothetical protein